MSQVDEKRHPRSNVTVSQVLEQWLEVARHEDSTRERYQDLIRLYIEPIFGATAAARIDAELLERCYARLRDCKDLCGGKRAKDHECTPLAANTVRKMHFIFRSAFDRAVRWRYLSVNQAEIAQRPSFERSEPDPPSAAEAASLLREASEDPQWCLLLWLTMVTGCRRGELCALRWGDVDLTAGMLSIERSYSKTRERAREKSTKTRQRPRHRMTLAVAGHRHRVDRDRSPGRSPARPPVFGEWRDTQRQLAEVTRQDERIDRLDTATRGLRLLRALPTHAWSGAPRGRTEPRSWYPSGGAAWPSSVRTWPSRRTGRINCGSWTRGRPVSAGVFEPAVGMVESSVVSRTPEGAERMAVTVEPEGGSARPTTEPVMVLDMPV
ncbi:hypothetical protein CDG81_03365 [Actinopolyspora erythraea]|uniref:Core-binding (CB) domain-containing protein n=1 Tax=Actinopolyspora erythraea TaxID=414996 RepID=A0A223RNS4_9ACTN|nr:anti-sigma factor [Actinopolyspora erythraea]ASU77506.1 hypothetical protein CDG81_03365 [Actinopolyspora erythraea]